MGKLVANARCAPLALLVLAACATRHCEPLLECTLALPADVVAATAALACRAAFPGADPQPLRDPLLHRVGDRYEIRIYRDDADLLRTTGDVRLGLRWPETGANPAALAWPSVVETRGESGTAPWRVRGELRVVIEPTARGVRLVAHHRGITAPSLFHELSADAQLAHAVAVARASPGQRIPLATNIEVLRERSPRVAGDWLASAELLCAEEHLASGDLAGAARHLDRAVDRAPQRYGVRLLRAALAQRLAMPATRARDLDLVASLPGTAPSGCAARATRVEAGREGARDASQWRAAARQVAAADPDAALCSAQRARALDGDDDTATPTLLAELAERQGDLRLAGELRLAALPARPSAEQLLAIAHLRWRAGDGRGAALWLAEGWPQLAGEPAARTLLGELGAALGAAAMTRALALSPTTELAEQFAHAWSDRAGRALLVRVPELSGFAQDLPATPWR